MTASSQGLGRSARYGALAVVAGLVWPLLAAAGVGAAGGPASVARQGTADLATLETMQPTVEWLAIDRSGWAAVPPREPATVREGDRVRTARGATARLIYFEGSATEIGADTNLVVQRLNRSPGGSIVGNLFQSVGTTVSRVVRLADTSASFEIETPAATALVRGTTPRVEVGATGTTRVANEPDETGGRVDVEAKDPTRGRVTLQPGEETTIVVGQPPSPPRPIAAATSSSPSEPERPVAVASPSPTFGPAPLEPQPPPRFVITPLPTFVFARPTTQPNRLLEGSPFNLPTTFRAPTVVPIIPASRPVSPPSQPISPSLPRTGQ
jgi:hypothetical protein